MAGPGHKQPKVFNDPVHGNITIHPLCVKIIDTPQFQRLRFIAQLGAVRYVYPGANHTRFDHSIGVCYLAGEWARKLRDTLPDIYRNDVREEDILCVKIAGLCHDLGHGPFSHMYEKYYLERIKASPPFKHEEQSVKMFQYLILANNLEKSFEDFGLGPDDIRFIKDLIKPQKQNEFYRNQPAVKRFLYQIVCNDDFGIDVDKMDYLERDCLHLNIKCCFDQKRLMQFSKVIVSEKTSDICFRDKEEENLYKLFELRYDLYRQTYCHKVTHVIHVMLADAMNEANGQLSIRGEEWFYCPHGHPAELRDSASASGLSCLEGHHADAKTRSKKMKAADCIEDMAVFTNLTDYLQLQITQSEPQQSEPQTEPKQLESQTEPQLESKGLRRSQEIIRQIFLRELYIFFRTVPSAGDFSSNTDTIEENLHKKLEKKLPEKGLAILARRSLRITVVNLDYSKEAKDPLGAVPFFRKRHQDQKILLKREMRIRLVPAKFQQHLLYLTCSKKNLNEATINVLKDAFKDVCDDNGYTVYE